MALDKPSASGPPPSPSQAGTSLDATSVATPRRAPARRIWSAAIAAAVALAACAGGGGGASSGCGPGLVDGFPRDERVPGAGAVRVTRSGLDFLADNAPKLAGSLVGDGGTVTDAGVALFPIAASQQKGTADAGLGAIDYTIRVCPAGPKPGATPPECNIEIDLPKSVFRLDAVTPNIVRLRGDVPMRLAKLPLAVDTPPAFTDVIQGAIGLGTPVGTGCDTLDKTKPTVGYKTFPLSVTLPIVAETLEPRDGATKVDIDAAVIDVGVADTDLAVCATCGFIFDSLGVCSFIVDQAKKGAIDSLKNGTLGEQLKVQLRTALCEAPVPTRSPVCPKGTLPKDGVCVYAVKPSVCMAKLLGGDGRLEASQVGSGLSGEGAVDYVLAAGGALDPAPGAPVDDAGYAGHTPNGVTLSLFGGAKPVTLSKCVPAVDRPLPAGLIVPDELRANTITPWPAATPGPHLGISIANRFLDHFLSGLYAGGGLCLGATTEQVDGLKTSLLSVVMPSLKNLTFEERGGAMALATRPQVPPRIEMGGGTDLKTDPLLLLRLDKFVIDFYVFSLDRYVRVFTFTANLALPINLQTGKSATNPKGAIVPVLGDMRVEGATVTGSDLLVEPPARIADALGTVLGGLTSQLTGSITPIDLSAAVGAGGLGVVVPEGGIRRITKGSDAHLGIFANFEPAPPAPAGAKVRLLERSMPSGGMDLASLSRATLPRLRVALSSAVDGATPEEASKVEFSYAVDQGARSAWLRAREAVVAGDDMALQGRHVLRVWARRTDRAGTEDVTPAELPFVIDALAPDVLVAREGERLRVRARDYVSPSEALRARVRLGDEPFGPWLPLDRVDGTRVGSATHASVEVRDEEANVGRADLLLIRGKGDPSLAPPAPAGCGCEAAGQPRLGGPAIVAALGLAALFGARRRRGRAVRLSPRRVLGAGAAAAALALLASVPACSCGNDEEPAQCGPSCKETCAPPLPTGMIGSYTSVAKAKNGTLYLTGYADATVGDQATGLYGDLVFGTFDRAKGAPRWEIVDGVPPRTDGTCPTNDRNGFRGGETEPGDDVGLYTSLALGEGERPLVAYHDATHRTLKFAYRGDDGWKSYVLFEKSKADVGRYAKLVWVENRAHVVFLVVEPGTGGKQRSRLVLAKASVATPRDAAAWSFVDVATDDDTPCWAGTCGTSEACTKRARRCEKTLGGCNPACAPGVACVTGDGGAPTCADSTYEPMTQAYAEAAFTYLAAAPLAGGIGIVAYDRPRGNLLSFVPKGAGFEAHLLDGETGSRANGTAKDTGDVGLGASLHVAPNGEWHIACVDGTREALVHLVVKDGVTVLAREVVDQGLTPLGAAFSDGKHIVGDDATVRVDDDGTVTICYQDATAGELRCAVGPRGRGFELKTLAQAGKQGGFFPQLVPGAREVLSFWRALDRSTGNYSGDVSLLSF